MSKVIKIIDLLNKIANGEELPEEIKYDNTIWQYNKANNDYYQDIGSTKIYFFAELVVYNKDWLNDTVEIIEEQEDIDIQSIKEIEPTMNGNECVVIDNKSWTLNQVIKAVKQLDKKIKEKE